MPPLTTFSVSILHELFSDLKKTCFIKAVHLEVSAKTGRVTINRLKFNRDDDKDKRF